MLKVLSAAVVEARSGKELISRVFGPDRFDLVVCDIRLPERSGVAVARTARAAGIATPFLFVSGQPVGAGEIDAVGPAAFLPKPFALGDLRDRGRITWSGLKRSRRRPPRRPPCYTRPMPTGLLLVNLGTPDQPTSRRGPPLPARVPVRSPGPRHEPGRPLAAAQPHHPAAPAAQERPRLPARSGTPSAARRCCSCRRTWPTAVAERLGDDWRVELAMRYGNPSIAAGLAAMREAGVDAIVVFPLFPQYASSTTGSAVAEVFRLAGREWNVPILEVVPPFWHEPGFLDAFAEVVGPASGRPQARPRPVLVPRPARAPHHQERRRRRATAGSTTPAAPRSARPTATATAPSATRPRAASPSGSGSTTTAGPSRSSRGWARSRGSSPTPTA